MAALFQFIRLSRPYNALLPCVAILAGYTISYADDLGRLLLTVGLFAILHSVVTIWNDFEDEDGDRLNGIQRLALVRKTANYQRYIRWMQSLVIISVLVGLVVGWRTVLLLLLYVFMGWLYNSEPARLSKRPLGSMMIMFLGYGLLPFALGASLGVWSWQVAVLGVGWSCTRLSLSLLKDYKDAPGDAKSAKKTFLLVYGGRAVAWLSIVLLGTGLLSVLLVASSRSTSFAMVFLIVVAFWLFGERLQLLKRHEYAGLHAVFKLGLRYQLAFDTLVVIWLRTR